MEKWSSQVVYAALAITVGGSLHLSNIAPSPETNSVRLSAQNLKGVSVATTLQSTEAAAPRIILSAPYKAQHIVSVGR